MAEADFDNLYRLLRFALPIGVVILLIEWIAWLAFVGPFFRWSIRYIQRALYGATRALPRTRVESSELVLVPGREGEWLFRPPYRFFSLATPFFLFGHVLQTPDRLEVVGRHPIGGALFFGAIVVQQLLLAFVTLLVPGVARQGFSVDLGALGAAAAVLVVFYGGSLALERHRFLKAVGAISTLGGARQGGAA